MSKNLLKTGYFGLTSEEARVIDTNELLEKRIQELSAKMKRPENEGFIAGIPADSLAVDALLSDEDTAERAGDGLLGGEDSRSNVIKAAESGETIRAEAVNEAQTILADAKEQADKLLKEAAAKAEAEREQVFARAREEGYADGQKQAEAANEQVRRQLADEKRQLEEAYEKQLEELEPQFIDTITGIYEHIFHVELKSYREILVYLISDTLRKVEDNRNFLIHVSREDYPYVSMQKKQILSGPVMAGHTAEIVEDLALAPNECLIETEGGIFDCGLDTQLTELGQKLKLLSYKKENG